MRDAAAADEVLITTFGRLVEAHSRLGRQLGRQLEDRAGVSLAEFEVLLRISRATEGRITMGDLAHDVALTTGGVTKLVDRMVAAGLVQRLPCPTDRRVQFAVLTPKGRRVLDKAARVHADDLRAVFDGFSERDLRALDTLLDRLLAASAV